jgi:hypothetical protein
MAIPKGFEVQDEGQDYVLKLNENLFGQKLASRVWNQHLAGQQETQGGWIHSGRD